MKLPFPFFTLTLWALVALFSSVPVEATAGMVAETSELIRNAGPRPPDAAPGANWWYYGVVLKETSGKSGIRLTGWSKCYITRDDVGCENVRSNFQKLYGTDRIPPGGEIRLLKPAWVWAKKTGNAYEVEGSYWGLDDNGNKVRASYRLKFRSD
ncbi:MAG: hypothetical protein HQ512_04755 [Rhodospirillales bacterium]|nr:hypothetical protein [Rhodospirillales bacterium]